MHNTAIQQDDILDADALLRRAGVGVGSVVADCGVGREAIFTLHAARLVGATGTVYALDVVAEVLDIVTGRAHDAGLRNIKTVWTDLEMLGAAKAVQDGSVDAVLLINTLFQSTNPEPILLECARMITPGGHLLIVDWVKDFATPYGPEQSQRLEPAEVSQYADQIGLEKITEFSAGVYHWGLLYKKPLPRR